MEACLVVIWAQVTLIVMGAHATTPEINNEIHGILKVREIALDVATSNA